VIISNLIEKLSDTALTSTDASKGGLDTCSELLPRPSIEVRNVATVAPLLRQPRCHGDLSGPWSPLHGSPNSPTEDR